MAAGSDSTFFSGEIDLNKSFEELQEKYPTRPAILVKVASIVTPAKFWVYEVPLAQKTPASVETRLDRVAAIEKSLQLLYNDVVPKLEPEGYIKDLKGDTMVAVRPSYRYQFLFINISKMLTFLQLADPSIGIEDEFIQSFTNTKSLPKCSW